MPAKTSGCPWRVFYFGKEIIMSVEKIKKAVIREDLLSITGNYKEAIILNQFIYWSERVNDADKFIEAENEIARKNGEEEREPLYGWIYKTAEELADEIMLGLSASQIRKYIANLVDYGYIQKRNNPKYKWDRTLQYKVNLVNIAKALKANGYPLSDYKIDVPEYNAESNAHQCAINKNKMSDQTVAGNEAIPEITTETTNRDYNTENTDINASNSKELNGYNINASFPEKKRTQTPFLDMNNCTPEEIEKHYSIRCKKIAQKHNITDAEKIRDAAKTISYFCQKYYAVFREDHPVLSDRALERVFINFCFPPELLDENGITTFGHYEEMIDRYFATEYGKYNLSGIVPDYSISHFMSDEILTNLCKNVFGIPHL